MMYSENIWRSFGRPLLQDYFLKVSRLDVAKQKSYTWPSNRFHEPEIWKSWKFPKYWRRWGVQASKFMKFARWRDFNALRRAHVSFQVTRRVVAPKSDIVYRGDCSTKGGRSIRRFSNFDLDFRDNKWCILKTFEDRLVGPCLKRCESRKLYVAKHAVPWTRNFEIMKFSKILTLVRGSDF